MDISYEFSEDYVDVWNNDGYFYTYEESFTDIWKNCVLHSVESIYPLLRNLIVLNFIFGLTVTYIRLPIALYHLFTGIIGIYLISNLSSSEGVYIIVCYIVILYMALILNVVVKKYFHINCSSIIKLILVLSLVFNEYRLVATEIFMEIRGIIMVFVMKVFSLIDKTNDKMHYIGPISYFGYVASGSNVLLGPWVSYEDYKAMYYKKRKKGIYWLLSILRSFILSMIFLSLSNCYSSYFIKDNYNAFLLTYRDAFSFRCSHYFVSYLAETGMLAAGFYSSAERNKMWSFKIVNPLYVECPTSLSSVVTKWNIPMHQFLKYYIYQPIKPFGSFLSILATFLASSFLHGLEVNVSIVLLSLGLFSYLQVKARQKISKLIDACLNTKLCKLCTHKFKRNDWITRIVLIIFSFITVFHLAYLGILMDPQTNDISIYEKWANLYFSGHIIMIINIIVIFI